MDAKTKGQNCPSLVCHTQRLKVYRVKSNAGDAKQALLVSRLSFPILSGEIDPLWHVLSDNVAVVLHRTHPD